MVTTIRANIYVVDDDPETLKAALDAGAIGYFKKLVDSDALLDAINWALMNGPMKEDSSG